MYLLLWLLRVYVYQNEQGILKLCIHWLLPDIKNKDPMKNHQEHQLFFLENFDYLISGGKAEFGELSSIFIPLGISFYTFQTLSYTIDVYRGTLRPSKSIKEFAKYTLFFSVASRPGQTKFNPGGGNPRIWIDTIGTKNN